MTVTVGLVWVGVIGLVGRRGLAELIFRWQNGAATATLTPQVNQVVRSTPLGLPCSGPEGYSAASPGLRLRLPLLLWPQSGYVPAPRGGGRLGDFPVLPRYTLRGGARPKVGRSGIVSP